MSGSSSANSEDDEWWDILAFTTYFFEKRGVFCGFLNTQ